MDIGKEDYPARAYIPTLPKCLDLSMHHGFESKSVDKGPRHKQGAMRMEAQSGKITNLGFPLPITKVLNQPSLEME
jgi:hypothetical protein